MRSLSSIGTRQIAGTALSRVLNALYNVYSWISTGLSTRFTHAVQAYEKKVELCSLMASYEQANTHTEPALKKIRVAGSLLSLGSSKHLILRDGMNYFRLNEAGSLETTESVSNSTLAISISGSLAVSAQKGEMRTNALVKLGSVPYVLKLLPLEKRFDLETYVSPLNGGLS